MKFFTYEDPSRELENQTVDEWDDELEESVDQLWLEHFEEVAHDFVSEYLIPRQVARREQLRERLRERDPELTEDAIKEDVRLREMLERDAFVSSQRGGFIRAIARTRAALRLGIEHEIAKWGRADQLWGLRHESLTPTRVKGHLRLLRGGAE